MFHINIYYKYMNDLELLLDKYFYDDLSYLIMKYYTKSYKHFDPNTQLLLYCEVGDYISIQELLNKYKNLNTNTGLYCACINGHISIIELMIDNGAWNIYMGFVNACTNNQLKTIKYLLVNNDLINYGFMEATITNNLINELVLNQHLLYNKGLEIGCENNYEMLVDLMIKKGATYCKNCKNTKHVKNEK